MKNKLKKIISVILSVTIVCLNGLNVMAANKIAEPLDSAESFVPFDSLAPRSIMHLSKSKWDASNRVKATIYYSWQESTNQLVGLRSASVADFKSPIGEAKVKAFGYYSGRKDAWVEVNTKITGSDLMSNSNS